MTDDADGAGNVAVLGTELTMTGSTLWATSSHPLYIFWQLGVIAAVVASPRKGLRIASYTSVLSIDGLSSTASGLDGDWRLLKAGSYRDRCIIKSTCSGLRQYRSGGSRKRLL
ncbi:hypothetical protein DPMN_121847 [Dreissena polymorpha]|uniref:Uncharacterized protein n=1 Tax=Dreissena polymorpha TaxID=45954 RepID=A0A9D4GNI5_DREPO|nr:hypothetical protein DPMN_121847 [Dreissena polymorpha]